jgi:hypothetical protein
MTWAIMAKGERYKCVALPLTTVHKSLMPSLNSCITDEVFMYARLNRLRQRRSALLALIAWRAGNHGSNGTPSG